ncbi:MAG: tetratricopeptide repeat protein [Sandaracinaceae bacterium]|jgi:Tfp pilus assembly protein PilF|nr:tetratricopeptide repeat protein [Sandaracinaceae bacterium]MBK7151632.1 tetratricopeptide repeat protein [Sandaracinaceae bacterium]MBK7775720.1 tetratricopeptide repeat protein [Sandaracinaceae bacterium]MBK8409397.1 tetratricopeptide repeat protein [Sandaracinaceae bacterium]MBK8592949.1 tetratricopeptide repeat protein [Sandaracinaceae bacterium]
MTRRLGPDGAYVALIQQARDAFRSGDRVRAEHLAREALAHDPERAAAYNLLAAVREMHGRHDAAVDLLRAGLAVEPTYEPAKQNLDRLVSHPNRVGIQLGDD